MHLSSEQDLLDAGSRAQTGGMSSTGLVLPTTARQTLWEKPPEKAEAVGTPDTGSDPAGRHGATSGS